MTHSHLLNIDEKVYVGSLASNMRRPVPELRMDGQNGFYKIIWLSKGNGRVMIDGQTRGIGPNTFVFVPASIPHVFEVGLNTYGTYIAIDPTSKIQFPSHSFIFALLNIMQQTDISKTVDAIVSEAASELPGKEINIEALVQMLLVHILRLTGDKVENVKETSAQRLMRKFTRILEARYHSGSGLSDYADVLGVTTTHLSRVSRSMNGKSAGQLIQDRILSEAQFLLLNSDLKMQDISHKLGFNSPAYFTRLFNAKMNQTPKDYRKSRARGPEEVQRIRARGL